MPRALPRCVLYASVAFWSLLTLGCGRPVPDWIDDASHDDPDVRMLAVSALGNHELAARAPEEVLRTLKRNAAKDPVSHSREAAKHALTKLGDLVLEVSLARLRHDPLDREALGDLRELCGESYAQPLAHALSAPGASDPFRGSLTRLLTNLGTPGWQSLVAVLSEGNAAVATPVLATLLSLEKPRFDPETTAAVLALTDASEARVRDLAHQVVAHLESAEIAAARLVALRDVCGDGADQAAAERLASFEADGTDAAIRMAILHPRCPSKATLMRILLRRGGVTPEFLRECERHDDVAIRRAAELARR